MNSLTILGVNQRHFFSVRELKIREANAMELYRLQVTLQLYPGLHCDITKTWGVSTIYGHCKCAKLTEVVQWTAKLNEHPKKKNIIKDNCIILSYFFFNSKLYHVCDFGFRRSLFQKLNGVSACSRKGPKKLPKSKRSAQSHALTPSVRVRVFPWFHYMGQWLQPFPLLQFPLTSHIAWRDSGGGGGGVRVYQHHPNLPPSTAPQLISTCYWPLPPFRFLISRVMLTIRSSSFQLDAPHNWRTRVRQGLSTGTDEAFMQRPLQDKHLPFNMGTSPKPQAKRIKSSLSR